MDKVATLSLDLLDSFRAGDPPPVRSAHQRTNRHVDHPPPDESQGVDPATRRIIDTLFAELKGVFPAWRSAWPDSVVEGAAKRQWLQALLELGIETIEQMRVGIERCRRKGEPWVCTAEVFALRCLPRPEELGLGLKPTAKAFVEAYHRAHPYADHCWSHTTVFHAAYEVGLSTFLQGDAKEARERFARAYVLACYRFSQGDPLRPLPKIEPPARPRKAPNRELAVGALAEIRQRLTGVRQ